MTQVQGREVNREYPESPTKPVTDLYHGHVLVQDNYRWLEDSNDPAVRKWVDEQNSFTKGQLERVQSRDQIRSRLKQLYSEASSIYYSGCFRGNHFFFMKLDPLKQQPYLVLFDDIAESSSERTVFDPNQFDNSSSTSIDFFVPSKDGKYVAISLSKGGTEDGSLHFFNVETGEKFPDLLPKVNYPTAGGSAEWNSDSTGIYYTRYPLEDERAKEDLHFYQQVYYHIIGTDPSEDKHVIGKEFPRIAEIKLSSPDHGEGLLVTVANGDGGEYCHYYLDKKGEWIQLTQFNDQVKFGKFSPDGNNLFLLSRKGSPRGKILKMSRDSLELGSARVLFEAREGSIEEGIYKGLHEVTDTKLFVPEVVGGPSKLFVYDHNGAFIREVSPSAENISSIDELVRLPNDALLVRSQSYLTPSNWYGFHCESYSFKKIHKLETRSPFDTSAYETIREFATSKDGTQVPINIILKKRAERNGNNPTILYGYGGYGISLKPAFQIHVLAWLDMGGIFVVANLRGGGEYGEEWHRGGMLTNKQNVFDDFVACAEYLIQSGYTRKEKLAIEGGSNGGLLMGAALTQRPDLFQAVVSHVGVYDMLRVELQDNGVFNITEYGTVKDPEHFRAIYGYSPYHRVVDGTRYPSILLLAGENDGRVASSHSKKMAARLQRASTSGNPILLRIDTAGHGFGTPLDQRIAQDTDVFSFLYHELELL